jgi:erythromycin esterase
LAKVACSIAVLTCALMFGAKSDLGQSSSVTKVKTEAQVLEPGKPVERELKNGETHVYQIVLSVGQFLDAAVNQRGVDVVLRVFAPGGSKLAEIDSPNGNQGDEPVVVEAKATGAYRVEVSPLEEGSPQAKYEIRINELLSADAYVKRLAESKAKQQIVIARLKENAIPVKAVEAGNGFQDLQPLKQVFKDVRYVGLGEETHGTREFFQFKHRMLEFLVKEMGFRVFAIEASYSACENINDYIMGKNDDGTKALDSQGFWTWNTEEVRAMIDWLRTYNASVTADKKVKFLGFDIQHNEPGQAKLLPYLKRVAPERVADTESFFKVDFAPFVDAVLSKGDKAKDELAKLNELKNQYNELFVFLELNAALLSAKSSQIEAEQMREYARVMVQYLDSYSRVDRSGSAARDLFMADNFRRLVGREPVGTRFVLWAHNFHISTTDSNGMYPTFGSYLRRFYSNDYYALGFSFNQGSFQSRDLREKEPSQRLLRSFTVTTAPVDSVDWYLAQTGVKSFVVDFRSARKSAELATWTTSPHLMRSIGSGYSPSAERATFGPTTVGKEYDGLFFIDATTRARPNPSVKNVAPQ